MNVRDRMRQFVMTIGEIMAHKLITVTPDTPLIQAARLLRQHRIGGLPVVEGERLVGIITETDLLQAFIDLLAAREEVTAMVGG